MEKIFLAGFLPTNDLWRLADRQTIPTLHYSVINLQVIVWERWITPRNYHTSVLITPMYLLTSWYYCTSRLFTLRYYHWLITSSSYCNFRLLTLSCYYTSRLLTPMHYHPLRLLSPRYHFTFITPRYRVIHIDCDK